ncbi:MAG TPA: alpha/beta fold hydrolase [Reyranella sp.]|nr:alpha/beta fold hydrolase [Reyranella sp.]
MTQSQQTFRLPATADRPSLFIRRQPRPGAPAVLYVHGATFPSALCASFDFGDGRGSDTWLDDWAARGFDAWAFDFAGFGCSGRYAEMAEPADRHGPLGRAAPASRQVLDVLDLIERQAGPGRVSLVAHSWGSMPAGLAAYARPDRIDRLVLFGPIAPRAMTGIEIPNVAWLDVTNEAQHARFIEDVPKDHAPVLVAFERWAPAYLASDPDAAQRTPPAVRVPAGPAADNRLAWSGRLSWSPGELSRPLAIVRGEWDGTSSAADAKWLLDAARHAPERQLAHLPKGTHLMHLETGRRSLYDWVGRTLKGEAP